MVLLKLLNSLSRRQVSEKTTNYNENKEGKNPGISVEMGLGWLNLGGDEDVAELKK